MIKIDRTPIQETSTKQTKIDAKTRQQTMPKLVLEKIMKKMKHYVFRIVKSCMFVGNTSTTERFVRSDR